MLTLTDATESIVREGVAFITRAHKRTVCVSAVLFTEVRLLSALVNI